MEKLRKNKEVLEGKIMKLIVDFLEENGSCEINIDVKQDFIKSLKDDELCCTRVQAFATIKI